MKAWYLNVGGGIAKLSTNTAGGVYPQGQTNCCSVVEPDATNNLGRQYFAKVAPSVNFSLSQYSDFFDNYAVGDRIVLTPIGAGQSFTQIAIENAHALAGFQFHIELVDRYAFSLDPASPALFTLPAVDGSVAKLDWVRVDGGKPVYGQKFGVNVVDGKNVACAKHMYLVMVIDALPTTSTVTTVGCKTCAYNVQACGGSKSNLHAINVSVSVPVEKHEGLQLV
jgi:hypothetical protein